jgi:hypothetical protein
MILLAFPLHVTWSLNGHGLILLVNGLTTAMPVWCMASGLTTTRGAVFVVRVLARVDQDQPNKCQTG